MNTFWSDTVQSPEELNLSRARRFREDNREQWLEVLEDVHQPYQLLDTSKNAMNMAEEPVFCGICRF